MKMEINQWTVLTALYLATVGVAFVGWLHLPPHKACFVRPLLKAIDAYWATNGAYPTSCVNFAAFSQVTNRFTVYTGGRDTNGSTWETRAVSDNDFTVLVDRTGYEVFLPVGRMKMIS